MNRSESIAQLATALAAAQAKIEGASKDRVNPAFKAKYADLASVWEACRAPLSENGLSIVQLPSSDGAVVTVETVLAHKSGEWMSSTLTMVATRTDPQGIGSAITYARRYALSAMVGVAPEDDDDGNAASQRPTYQGSTAPAARPPPPPPKPASPPAPAAQASPPPAPAQAAAPAAKPELAKLPNSSKELHEAIAAAIVVAATQKELDDLVPQIARLDAEQKNDVRPLWIQRQTALKEASRAA